MKTILIIEDNEDSLELIILLLSQSGYTTITALDGEEGVALAKQEVPDLVICDIHISKLNGFEVVKILKQYPELKQIPLVAVTASAILGDRKKILASGFDAYIEKPINPVKFALQIEDALSSKEKIFK